MSGVKQILFLVNRNSKISVSAVRYISPPGVTEGYVSFAGSRTTRPNRVVFGGSGEKVTVFFFALGVDTGAFGRVDGRDKGAAGGDTGVAEVGESVLDNGVCVGCRVFVSLSSVSKIAARSRSMEISSFLPLISIIKVADFR